MARGEKEALNINEAAAFLGVHAQTVRKLARKGELPAFKVGRAWRFHRKALQVWVDTHHQRSRSSLVLVADDEQSVRFTVGMFLEDAGYRVVQAPGGAEAIAAAQVELPDAVIVDLAMPGVSGVQVLKELHALKPGIPAVILTGYPDGALMQEALQFAPLIVVSKPAKLDELLNAVRRALND